MKKQENLVKETQTDLVDGTHELHDNKINATGSNVQDQLNTPRFKI